MIHIRFRKMHFVGIGGIGMSGLAEVFMNLGFEISGSDISENENIIRLRKFGIPVAIGHRGENVNNKDVVIYSSSIKSDNPEIVMAHQLKIPVIRRAELLSELVRMKYSILVSGAHGKTTTTSLISTMFIDAGLDPTVIIGGRLNRFGTNAILGKGEYLIAESDESDGSFLSLLPTIAVITNIDKEHLDFYRSFSAIKESFVTFANKVPFYGFVIACADDVAVREILPKIEKRVITYGFSKECNYFADNVSMGSEGSEFDIYRGNEFLGRIRTSMRGRHNVLNSLATVAVGDELNIPFGTIGQSLAGFKGIGRRFQIKGEKDGVLVIDDYGHHPTEIKATLETARLLGRKRIFVVFQPHRYTRTRFLMEDFASLLSREENLILMDIYSAQETPISGVDSSVLLDRIRALGNKTAMHISDTKEIVRYLKENAADGDLILTVGAGSVYKIGEEFLKGVRE
ncbi:MAG: UDP-N-acetylmuramate--L-alanine ligase [Deltaproteobacteria bacterium]|nr:UDP-N-acetylmuramate--L-alanine ligase [Deltaproteobacteria bacterium]